MEKLFTAVLGLLMVAGGGLGVVKAQTVAGSAVDGQSGEPLLFANVVLVRASDTTQITGTSTDEPVFKPIAKSVYHMKLLRFHTTR